MAALYHSLFTEKGLALLRESIQNGTKLGITHMSFGDGGGMLPTPDATFTHMVNEVYRVALNRLAPSRENPNWLEADGVIPSAVGGFNIREVGLWAGNVMVAYANYPPTYKPSGDQGTAQIKSIRIVLQIDNTANFELKIDASVVMATVQYVQDLTSSNTAFLESVEELRNIEPRKNGAIIFVKQHTIGIKSGGLNYYWDENNNLPDDNGSIIKSKLIENGRWCAIFGNDVSIKNFGAMGNKQNDDRLAAEAAANFVINRGYGKVIFEGGEFLINSYASLTKIKDYSAGIFPLLSNIHYEIRSDATIFVGPFFHNKDFLLFTDIVGTDQSNYEHQYNWKIDGGGRIDFSLAGYRVDKYKMRQAIYLVASHDIEIQGIVFQNGDLPNCITTGLYGSNIEINSCVFSDLVRNKDSKNNDHSTIYGSARATRVLNCQFKATTTKMKVIGCAVELHNSDSIVTGCNVDGYRNGCILAAINTEQPYVSDNRIYGNTFRITQVLCTIDSWSNTSLINSNVYGNTCSCISFPTSLELEEIGYTSAEAYADAALLRFTITEREGYDQNAGIGSNNLFHDNVFVSESTPEEYSNAIFIDQALPSGISVYRNKLSVKRLFKQSSGLKALPQFVKFNQFKFYDNEISTTNLSKIQEAQIDLKCQSIIGCLFSIEFSANTLIDKLIALEITDTDVSGLNTIKVSPQYLENVDCLTANSGFLEKTNNKFSYPKNVGVYISPEIQTIADFYMKNISNAKILNRMSLPQTVVLSDFMANLDQNNKLQAIGINTEKKYGTYEVRMLLSNY